MASDVKVTVQNRNVFTVMGGIQKLDELEWFPYALRFRCGRVMAALSDQARMLEERRAEIVAKYKVKEDKEKQLVELNDTGKEQFAALLEETGPEVPTIKVSELIAAAKKNSDELPGLTSSTIAALAPIITFDAEL